MEDVQSPKGGGQQSGKALGDTSPSTNTKKRLSDRPATADDLLDWLLEILTLNGSIGMSGEWDQKSFTGALAMEVDEDGHLSGGLPDDTSLTAALGRLICDWSREKYLVDLTDQHKALYPEALRRVDAKLRAGGVSEVMIAKMKPGAKLIKYASVISGRLGAVDRFPKPRHFFVYVMSTKDPTGHIKDYRQLWFPKNVHFGHFMGVLRDMTAYAAERTGHDGGGYMLCDGPWYYNLLGPDKKIFLDAPRQEIVDEESFEVMLLQVRNKDTPGITIFHVRVSFSLPSLLNLHPSSSCFFRPLSSHTTLPHEVFQDISPPKDPEQAS